MSAKCWHRLSFETKLWQKGLNRVAGVDEAGRGPLAGPVVAAAVILPSRWAGVRSGKSSAALAGKSRFAFLRSERYGSAV